MVLEKHFKYFSTVKINHYILSVFLVSTVGLACTPFANSQSYHVVSFLLLFLVSLLATFMWLGPVLLASTLSALIWNFFFIPPSLTFHIDKAEDLLMFSMFFIIALLNGILNTKVRKNEKIAREREAYSNALFQLSKELSKARGIDKVLEVATSKLKNYFNTDPIFVLQDGNNSIEKEQLQQNETTFSSDEQRAALASFREHKAAGDFTLTHFTFFPLTGILINPGIVGVKIEHSFFEKQNEFWDTCLTQISNALEREFLGEMAQKVRFLDESDRLYKTLFNSISHEFRIPVATIMCASDTLLNTKYNADTQKDLFKEIFTASLRLNRLIENLLNISRLESGHLSVRMDWHDMNDLINKVSKDLKEELREHFLIINIPENLPPVKIDFGLMEQVIYNLLINSIQYAPKASEIILNVSYEQETLIIRISDNGPGFPDTSLKNVFNKFYNLNENKTGGLGLGLSIVKGFIEAHKGEIQVRNKIPTGSEFTIKLFSEVVPLLNIQNE